MNLEVGVKIRDGRVVCNLMQYAIAHGKEKHVYLFSMRANDGAMI